MSSETFARNCKLSYVVSTLYSFFLILAIMEPQILACLFFQPDISEKIDNNKGYPIQYKGV